MEFSIRNVVLRGLGVATVLLLLPLVSLACGGSEAPDGSVESEKSAQLSASDLSGSVEAARPEAAPAGEATETAATVPETPA